jgi:hypothetical protein
VSRGRDARWQHGRAADLAVDEGFPVAIVDVNAKHWSTFRGSRVYLKGASLRCLPLHVGPSNGLTVR